MNNLSWLIYLADVSNDLDWLVFWIAFISGITACISTWCWADALKGTDESKSALRVIKLAIPMALGFYILSALIPAKETVYAIAASEMGEAAFNTQTGGKAVQALNAWLDRQIEGEPDAATQPAN